MSVTAIPLPTITEPTQPRVFLAHPGTQYSFRLAQELARLGYLEQFWTGLCFPEQSAFVRSGLTMLPSVLRRRLANRVLRSVPPRLVHTSPALELRALRRLHRGDSPQLVNNERNRLFQESIPEEVLLRASAVIGFDTSSWILAATANRLGRPFFLDQSICHPLEKQRALEEAERRFPQWKDASERRDSEVLRHEEEEYRRADCIVAASSYTRRTLVERGVPAEKIVVNPYGVDLDWFTPAPTIRRDRPLRFLFVGLIGARKGVPLLLEAWRALEPKDAELWLVGPTDLATRRLLPDLPGLRVIGKQPHESLPEVFRKCDVLVFPSFSEGFGLVILEALASGLPVITTDATAGPDILTTEDEGLVIPPNQLEPLVEGMRRFLQNEDRLPLMRFRARQLAERYTWSAYGERWAQLLP